MLNERYYFNCLVLGFFLSEVDLERNYIDCNEVVCLKDFGDIECLFSVGLYFCIKENISLVFWFYS